MTTDTTDRRLKLYIFCCSSSLDTEKFLQHSGGLDGDILKIISLPCSGKIDVLYLLKAFETGADGVVVVTCKEGECKYLEGNLRARKRAEAVDSLMEEIGLGRGRMTVVQMKDGGTEEIIEEIKSFLTQIGTMPSPWKK